MKRHAAVSTHIVIHMKMQHVAAIGFAHTLKVEILAHIVKEWSLAYDLTSRVLVSRFEVHDGC